MAKPLEDNTSSPVNAPDGGAVAPAAPADADGQKSWGDKYKAKALHVTRNISVNYVVNFAISTLLTYAVMKSPLNAPLERGIGKVAAFGERQIGIPKRLGEFVGEFFTRTQILLCGGHALLPFMKYTHDHKLGLEFELGHKLDQLQQATGRGNAATRRNLTEYKYIKDLMAAGKPRDLTDNDKALLGKNGVGDNLQFNERRKTWKQLLKARGIGMTATTTLSGVFALGSYFGSEKHIPWIDVKETYLKRGGGKFGEKYLKGLSHIGVKDSELFGQLIVLELLYTAASKLGFDHMEKRQYLREKAADAAATQAEIKKGQTELTQLGVNVDGAAPATSFATRPASGSEARRRLIEQGAQDFRTREATKPGETAIGMT